MPYANPKDISNILLSLIENTPKILTKLNSTQIRDYQIADFPANQIKLVFDLLNPITLGKVLLNIDKTIFFQLEINCLQIYSIKL